MLIESDEMRFKNQISFAEIFINLQEKLCDENWKIGNH